MSTFTSNGKPIIADADPNMRLLRFVLDLAVVKAGAAPCGDRQDYPSITDR
ncbi:MAG: hypothetical protein QF609_01230 [Gammaproteobacteria bacterium]|jgi:hypothetical protein|nr:hypothetical protein [Gammaproteobacteria bacterium]HJP36752.1 hypothetical protein [Gammaproteobacteria bacterium]